MRYLVIIEEAEKNFAAYSLDLPGCVATGATLDMREAIDFHLEGLRLHGDPVPEPASRTFYVDVEAA